MVLIRLLGPVDVVDDRGVVCRSPSARRRTLLALLALRPGELLHPDWLLEHVWDGDVPDSGRRALRFHVSKLRRESGAALVETSAGGYRLRVDRSEVDVGLVEDLARAARDSTDPEHAAGLCAEALEQWRGEPFVDAAPAPDLADEAVRLAELRLSIVELAHRRRLDAGEGASLVAGLVRLTTEHPLREELWHSLVIAQYRAGRQADALRSFDTMRTHLRDTLGVDPGPDMQELHRRVLQQDPGLLARDRVRAAEPPAPLPAGTVTFVSTDIEGSTRLLQRLGEAYEAVLDRQRELLRHAWSEHGGVEVDVDGDGSLVAFADATSAVRACAAAQRALGDERWEGGSEVRVRMAIHRGPATPRHGDYVALAVHQLARIVGCAHGGQVVLTDEVAPELPTAEDLHLVPLGSYRLRDFERPVRLHQLAGPGLAETFPPLRALPADGHNLVRPPTSFTGRDEALAALRDLVRPGAVVTIVGLGGVGKTRLAVELGLAVTTAWSDGVWIVELAPLPAGHLVGPAVASVLGVRTGTGDPTAELVDHLRSRDALLVLDNAEHVAPGCIELIDAVRAGAPTTGILVTSREPLGTDGEVVVRLGPLALAPSGAGGDAARSSAAVQLFANRAEAVRTGFVLDEQTAANVAAICRRLDGLPLAIEMAAALVAVQSPAEILAGLRERSTQLSHRDRRGVERHRSMETVLNWSHRLLDEDQRIAFRRLSPFAAGFTLDAASVAVASDGIAAIEVAPIVWSLVDASLVTADLAANDTRYRLPEPVRDYARARLHERHEAASVARRVAQWCLGRAAPWGNLDRRWLAFMGAELDNVRAVLPLLSADDAELAQQLVATIGQYHDARGTYREGARELALAARAFPRPTRSRIAVLNRLADLQLRLGALDAAARTVDEAETLRAQLGAAPAWDDAGVARARGELQLRAGDDEGAEATARRALAESPSTRSQARLWNLLGLAIATRDLPGALEAFHEELAIYERLGYEVRVASASGNVAELCLRAGDVVGAARHQLTTLQLGLEQGWDLMVAYSMIVAARLAAGLDDWGDALALAVDAAAMVETTGIMLFDEDRAVLDELVAKARAELGVPAADALADAATGDPAVGAARARTVLERHLT